MEQQSTERLIESRPSWEDVEAFARQRIQSWFQRLLEEEVEELLGRPRYVRRDGIDAPGYRNGLGKPRRLTLSAGDDHHSTAAGPRPGGAFRESPPAGVQAPDRGRGPVAPDPVPTRAGRRRL
jgi:hypothetical protein